ncbi:MAG: Putative oxidoreductase [uncultured Sulfurovum sp.]|uniref:Oxidoreductase n=1 Tax=uncultured Sulfurovum sp. TaxID=269237 RepID=A0A6S6S7X4_9BACT|nr:MAG: Putative oxidoreductase [uncultured Sulfurovum sp.]
MNEKAINVLAFSLGFLLLFHGVDKVLNGTDFIEEMLQNANVPYAKYVTYGVFIGEIVAPVLLIIGRYISIAGGIIAFNMLVAIILAHKETVFTLSEHGGWSIELQLLYLSGGLALAFLGRRN